MTLRLRRLAEGLCLLTTLVLPDPQLGAQESAQKVAQPANLWQFSVPLEQGTERRAYLWVPPACKQVRAVLFGLQNMLERDMFEDAEIRKTAAALDIAIVLVSPGAWPGKTNIPVQPDLHFTPARDAAAAVQAILDQLAQQSGYAEIREVPLIVTGHSAAMPFVWGMAATAPERVAAALPFKGSADGPLSSGVPTLYIDQEWGEWGEQWGDEHWRLDLDKSARMRAAGPNVLVGDVVDMGSGHFDWHAEMTPLISLFLEKVMRFRVSTGGSGHPSAILTLRAGSGVLADAALLGTAAFKAVPCKKWQGKSAAALWYFDEEMAEAVNRYMKAGLERKPQAIDFTIGGQPAPLEANGFATLKPEFLPDGVRFRVHAEPLAVSPSPHLFGGKALGAGEQPIQYRVSSGALRQVGADTFEVAARSGGMLRQGNPWEPWILAYKRGDDQFRSADRPAHILIDVRNKRGEPQEIRFQPLPAQVSVGERLKLNAEASSGLPVQFFIESGPAVIEGSTLIPLAVPPRSRYPVEIIVSAFQWGRTGDRPVQSAGLVTQIVRLTKSGREKSGRFAIPARF